MQSNLFVGLANRAFAQNSHLFSSDMSCVLCFTIFHRWFYSSLLVPLPLIYVHYPIVYFIILQSHFMLSCHRHVAASSQVQRI